MTEFYDVYVGNLSTMISPPNLRYLFSTVGKIVSVWIKMKHQRVTYGFVTFYYLDDARNACKTFNSTNVDGLTITVNLSLKTEQKLSQSVKKKTDLLLELPKRTEYNKLDRILRRQMGQIGKANDKQFVSDFVSALKEMDNISCKPCEIIKTEPEKTDLQTLENLVVRYYNKPVRKKKIEIDIDLSKQNEITSTLNAKLFDISFD